MSGIEFLVYIAALPFSWWLPQHCINKELGREGAVPFREVGRHADRCSENRAWSAFHTWRGSLLMFLRLQHGTQTALRTYMSLYYFLFWMCVHHFIFYSLDKQVFITWFYWPFHVAICISSLVILIFQCISLLFQGGFPGWFSVLPCHFLEDPCSQISQCTALCEWPLGIERDLEGCSSFSE